LALKTKSAVDATPLFLSQFTRRSGRAILSRDFIPPGEAFARYLD
jgi:hypothetical protein